MFIVLGKKIIKTDRVFEAMSSVDRAKYAHGGRPYVDAPQSIGYSVTISAPHMVIILKTVVENLFT